MRIRNLILVVATVVLAGLATALVLNRTRGERGLASTRTYISETPVDMKSVTIVPRATATPPLHEAPAAEAIDQGTRVVRVRPDQVLAAINGVAITLKDLIPLEDTEAGAEQTLESQMYEFLLKRAIERELTFQAARAQGVELSGEQQRQLAEMRSALERQDPDVVQQLTMNSARIEFDIRDATGLMLQANLAAHAGLPSPHVTPEQVEQYYASHTGDYRELPADPAERQAAWQEIDLQIRQKLVPQVEAEYQRNLRALLDQLKASANIVVTTQDAASTG